MPESRVSQSARTLAGSAGGTNGPQNDTRLLISETEAAEMVGLSPRKVWQLAKDGVLPTVRIDRRKLYVVDGLRRWVDQGCPMGGGQ